MRVRGGSRERKDGDEEDYDTEYFAESMHILVLLIRVQSLISRASISRWQRSVPSIVIFPERKKQSEELTLISTSHSGDTALHGAISPSLVNDSFI